MSYTEIDYTQLLGDLPLEIPFWEDLFTAFGDVSNPVIEAPREDLQNIRSPNVEPYYASLNLQMLGFKAPALSFMPPQYKLLMANMGKFIQTRGASAQFINFIGYILNTKLGYIPLWADNISDINSLNAVYGTPIWEAGTWFPTPFYDIEVNIDDFPTTDAAQLTFLFTVLEPIHLVLRQIIFLDALTIGFYLAPVGFGIIHDIGYASR
jgi:hypothetical protein